MIRAIRIVIVLLMFLPLKTLADRDFAERQAMNLTGDFRMIGNTNITCSSDCGGNTTNNPPAIMSYYNADVDGINFNSSRSELILPAGATIEWAGLYWTAVSQSGVFSNITGPVNSSLEQQVRFRTPAGGYTNITATQFDTNVQTGDLDSDFVDEDWRSYMAFAEVTSLVQSGGAGNYYVGNIQSDTGSAYTGPNAGWSLVVVYKAAGETFKRVNVWDGWKFFGFGTFENFTITGLLTPNSGTVEASVGIWAMDGEVANTGDQSTLATVPLTNALNPTDNFANGTISDNGVNVSTRDPNFTYNWGIDLDIYNANGILSNNITSADVSLGSSFEGIWAGVYAISTRLVVPTIEKSFSASTVNYLQTSQLSITIDNPVEGLTLTGVNLTDSLPAGMVVSNGPSTTNSCGGTFSPSAGDSVLSLTGGSVGPGSSCTFTVNVITNAGGSFDNVIPKEDLDTNEGVDAQEDAQATLVVNGLNNGSISGNVSEEVTADLIADNPLSGVTVNLIQRYNVIDSRIDINGDGLTNGADDGMVGGFIIVNGFVDISGNAVSNGADDGSLGGVTVINGRLDMDGNGSVNNTDRVNDDGILTVSISSQVTDGSGNYTFSNLTPGDYVLQQVNLASYVDLSDTDISDDGDGASDPVDNEIPVVLANGENDSGNNFVDRPPLADISVTKENNPNTVATYTPGANFEYTIVVTNNGPHAADGTTIVDDLPNWATGVTWTCSAQNGAVCPADGSGDINTSIPTFPNNGIVTFTVTGTYSTDPSTYSP